MKRISILFAVALLFTACEKDQDDESQAIECTKKMKERYQNELECRDEGFSATHLFQATYQGEIVYYLMLVCPSCDVIGPTEGVTCSGKKVTFNQDDLQEQKLVYNSCTKTYVE